jgi:hypothetical protein
MSNFSWKLFVAPAVLIVLLAIGYPVLWHVAAARAERFVVDWVDARRGDGWTIVHDEPEIDGFPLELRVALPRLAVAADPEGWRWKGRGAALAFQPWDWRRIRIEVHGRQAWEFLLDGAWRQFGADAARSVFIGVFGDNGHFSEAAIEIDGLTLAGPDDAGLFAARTLRGRFRRAEAPGGAPAHRVALRMDQARITDRYRLPLGQTIAHLEFNTRLRGGLPRDFDPASVEVWRRAGGTVEIAASELSWGPARARATGRLTLDRQMRPEGSLQSELQGYDETLAALEGTGLIRPRDAATARIALGLLARNGLD